MKEILNSILALVLVSLTQGGGEIPPELQAEVDALTASINALEEGSGEPPVDQAEKVAEITNKLNELAGKIKNTGEASLVMNKVAQAKMIVVDQAMKAYNTAQKELMKGMQAPKVLNYDFNAMVKNQGLRVIPLNVNNTNFEKGIYEEFSFSQKLRQDGFLVGLNVRNLEEGTNVIRWTEGTRGANATAIIAIGSDRPTKANTTAPSIEATNTIGEQTTISLQLLKAVNGVQEAYNDDLKKDIEDKIALQAAAIIATAANPINVTQQVTEGAATLNDVITYAYLQIKQYAGGRGVVIAVSSQAYIGLSLLKDKNGNKIEPVSFPDLQIVTFLANETYTDDKIFGWVNEGSVRFYNDGLKVYSDELNGIGVSGDNFKKSQITLAAQYLNEAMLLRGTDILTTIYDSIAGVIAELTPQNLG